MSARRRSLLIALLLPFLALRALLPSGYMPVAGPDGLRVALCSDGLQVAPGIDTAGDGRNDHGQGSSGQCHFSHGGAKAPPPTLLTLAAPPLRVANGQAWVADDLSPPPGPPRITAARAPPTLS